MLLNVRINGTRIEVTGGTSPVHFDCVPEKTLAQNVAQAIKHVGTHGYVDLVIHGGTQTVDVDEVGDMLGPRYDVRYALANLAPVVY